MNDDVDSTPVDLSPLDPTRDPSRFDAIVTGISGDAMMKLLALQALPQNDAANDVFDRLSRWWPATLVAAGLILAVSVAGLFLSSHRTRPASAMDVLGISPELSDVLRSQQVPSLSELRAALTVNSGQ
jgi:hypothetical protein